MNLYPLACIPYGRALGAGPNNGCHEELATYVELHNKAFFKLLEKLESELKGFRYSFSHFHKFITQRIDHPSEYGMFSTFLTPVVICSNLIKNIFFLSNHIIYTKTYSNSWSKAQILGSKLTPTCSNPWGKFSQDSPWFSGACPPYMCFFFFIYL